MIPVEQRHMAVFDEAGDNLQRGDCLTACVASILELSIDEVPFFVESDNWHQDYHQFFRDRGFVVERASMSVADEDPSELAGWPHERYWIATVYSPRGKARCNVCNGDKQTSRQWDGDRYVEFEEPQPCTYCDATGLVPSLHAVVMYGRELVWDPHPQRDMGHLGFLGGEQFGVADPARLVSETGSDHVNALVLTDEQRAKLEQFRGEGLLWLVNSAVLHPRGYALAVHLADGGAAIGLSVVGDGDEPWCFENETAAESCAQFNMAELARESVWAPKLRGES